METINVTLPGTYKRVKRYAAGRVCKCGALLSIYNKRNMCYTCDRR